MKYFTAFLKDFQKQIFLATRNKPGNKSWNYRRRNIFLVESIACCSWNI